jgi:phosphate transport system protein
MSPADDAEPGAPAVPPTPPALRGLPGAGYRHFHEQLAALKERLLAMSEDAESLVELAVEALLEGDRDKADAVIAGDRALDASELAVEGLAIQLLALQQPMARDLRFLVAAIKVSSDLERVGDHAVNIAQSVHRLEALPALAARPAELAEMARRARRMLGDALDAFTRGDGVLGREVCRSDDQVDALYGTMSRLLLADMTSDARLVPAAVELLLVSRNLERVGDLATNIAEDAVFVAEGKQIRHGAELAERRAS